MKNRISFRLFSLLVCLCVLTLHSSGCASLRKKFTRTKKDKNNEQAFIPVLDPVDYPPASVVPQERYGYHYSLLKVWQRDLVQNIERRESDKNQKYLIGQILVQLEEMKRWVADAKKQQLSDYISEWNTVLALYDQPAAMRSSFTLKKKVEALGKTMRNEFNPKVNPELLVAQ